MHIPLKVDSFVAVRGDEDELFYAQIRRVRRIDGYNKYWLRYLDIVINDGQYKWYKFPEINVTIETWEKDIAFPVDAEEVNGLYTFNS